MGLSIALGVMAPVRFVAQLRERALITLKGYLPIERVSPALGFGQSGVLGYRFFSAWTDQLTTTPEIDAYVRT